ncbi:MAG: hypothetical protein IJ228_00810 [Succinivibrio sp.]|nr:hypothetical protein [Succinivibrio sp.]
MVKNASQNDRNPVRKIYLFQDVVFRRAVQLYPELIPVILQAVMEMPDLKIKVCRSQADLMSLSGRSAILDVLAQTSKGTRIAIEVHNSICRSEIELRAEFLSAMLTSHAVGKGINFARKRDRARIPEQYVIFICKRDLFGLGWPYYDAERLWINVPEDACYHGKAHIRVINGAYRADDPIGRLMHDMHERKAGKLLIPTIRDTLGQILKINDKEGSMDRESKQLYNFLFADKEKSLRAEIDAKDAALNAQAAALNAKDAALNAKDAALNAKDAELNRYRALFGALPPQQPPAAPAQH